VTLPAAVVERVVLGTRIEPAAAMAAQAILGLLGFEMHWVPWNQGSLVGHRESHEEDDEKDHHPQDHNHAAVQLPLTSVRGVAA
jgi:hypothetical protein